MIYQTTRTPVIIHVPIKWLKWLHWALYFDYPDVTVGRDFPLITQALSCITHYKKTGQLLSM